MLNPGVSQYQCPKFISNQHVSEKSDKIRSLEVQFFSTENIHDKKLCTSIRY